jgi:hypothetical protein
VLRLGSLLWRLRRPTTMETGLSEIRAEHSHDDRQSRPLLPNFCDVIHAVFQRADTINARTGWHNRVDDLGTMADARMKTDVSAGFLLSESKRNPRNCRNISALSLCFH